ncbi:MAG: FlgD immunoglobulin-like domain containing protein [Candidatus Delongbacteria bacterium]
MYIRSMIAAVLILISQLFAGLVNVNPDTKGELWIAGGLRIPDNFNRNSLDFIQNSNSKQKELPSKIDNSVHKYFRPVFNQVGGSCSQAAGVGYTFTYEMDRLRDLDASTTDNQYPTHFTYNFLNEGSGEVGSWWGDGWDIMKSVGIMNITEYGGHFASGGNSRWISGINEWSSAHYNKVNSYNAIDVGTEDGLNTLKNWLHNHLEDSPYGGLAVFAAGATSYHERTLAEGTPEAGKRVITKWGPDVNHAMTYVGYDDSIRYDYNGDGRFTNDVDLNGDRIIDMRDWEIGAVIVANSWGDTFGNGGFIYQMYKLLADGHENGGIFYSFVDVVNPAAVSEPRWALEVKMKHEQRNVYRINTGVSQDVYAQTPAFSGSYPFMNYQGGDYYPQGGRTEFDKYIEFTIDISEMVTKIDPAQPFRYFFMTDESDPGNKYDGEIISITVVDRATGRRYYDPAPPVLMVNNGRTTVSVLVDDNTFVPENVSAFAGDGIVRLSWSGMPRKDTSFLHYNIYRDGLLYAQDLSESVFSDENVTNGSIYTYRVAAEFSGTFTGEISSLPVQAMPSEPSTLPYFIDFEEGTSGWTVKGDLSGWLAGDVSYSSEFCDYSGNSTTFLLANPDLAGNETVVRDHAATPLLSISNYDQVTLDFDYILTNEWDFDYFCDIIVMYRTGIDQDWVLIEELADSPVWAHRTINIPAEATASNYTQIAFFIEDYFKWSMGGGGIDNVGITGTFKTSAPSIISYYPAETTFTISDDCPVLFSVDVEDDDTGPSELTYSWSVNGDIKQTGSDPYFSGIFGWPEDYTVTVTVSDSYDEDSRSWTVTQTDIDEVLPVTTKLYQNYPNPFNPTTVIRFDNSKRELTSLFIFNSNGQKVRTLYDGMLERGSRTFIWDGRNDSGSSVSSGVYYYTVSSGKYSHTNKMMLFK